MSDEDETPVVSPDFFAQVNKPVRSDRSGHVILSDFDVDRIARRVIELLDKSGR